MQSWILALIMMPTGHVTPANPAANVTAPAQQDASTKPPGDAAPPPPVQQKTVAKSADDEAAPVRFALRLGPQFGPRFGYTAGLDIELNQLSMEKGWSTRFDLDLLWQPRGGALFDNVNTLFGVTVNQVYSLRQSGGRHVYGGFGLGGYGVPIPGNADPNTTDYSRFYTDQNRFGGKLFFGTQFTANTGIELDLHMVESSRPIFAVQARVIF